MKNMCRMTRAPWRICVELRQGSRDDASVQKKILHKMSFTYKRHLISSSLSNWQFHASLMAGRELWSRELITFSGRRGDERQRMQDGSGMKMRCWKLCWSSSCSVGKYLFAREATNSLPPSSSSTVIHPSFPLLQTLWIPKNSLRKFCTFK